MPDLRGRLGLFPTVEGGRAFLVQVPGSALSSLDDASLAALLNWMIGRFGPAGSAERYPPYAAEEVARLRLAPLTDVEPLRSDLLEAIATTAPAQP